MTERELQPPGGDAAPSSVMLDEDTSMDLVPLARKICRLYREEFPDEVARYGDAGMAWCVHDNQYLLSWAAEAINGYVEMQREVGWLANVLEARDFPLERLARNLDIAADVAGREVNAKHCERLARVLRDAATFIRSRKTFLD